MSSQLVIEAQQRQTVRAEPDFGFRRPKEFVLRYLGDLPCKPIVVRVLFDQDIRTIIL
jgi:hypothetical protein